MGTTLPYLFFYFMTDPMKHDCSGYQIKSKLEITDSHLAVIQLYVFGSGTMKRYVLTKLEIIPTSPILGSFVNSTR